MVSDLYMCAIWYHSVRSPSRSLRDEDPEPELVSGAAVEADFKGRGKYYPGKISRVRLNGTFDIDYDDGEKELGVPRAAIKAKAAA